MERFIVTAIALLALPATLLAHESGIAEESAFSSSERHGCGARFQCAPFLARQLIDMVEGLE